MGCCSRLEWKIAEVRASSSPPSPLGEDIVQKPEMFRGGVGRGFVAGYAGLAMIILALLVLLICCCCWFHELMHRRRRRLSLEEQMYSEQTLREDSPKFLKLLANKENARRASCATSISDGPPGVLPIIRKCEVMYSGAVCPYQAQSSYPMYPMGDVQIVVQ